MTNSWHTGCLNTARHNRKASSKKIKTSPSLLPAKPSNNMKGSTQVTKKPTKEVCQLPELSLLTQSGHVLQTRAAHTLLCSTRPPFSKFFPLDLGRASDPSLGWYLPLDQNCNLQSHCGEVWTPALIKDHEEPTRSLPWLPQPCSQHCQPMASLGLGLSAKQPLHRKHLGAALL